MAARPPPSEAPIGDDALRAKTGRSWDEWVAALDAAGARGRPHREIVAIVAERFAVGPWWQQMVAVGYERLTGARVANQTTRGFRVSGSKAVPASLDQLWRAWVDDATRARWLSAAPYTVRKATKEKSLRITWPDGTDLQVLFYAKGAGKSMVALEHGRLDDLAAVERQREFWRDHLGRLRALLEG